MKSKLQNIIIVLSILMLSRNVFAQNPIIDSLKLALKNAKHDTTRCLILCNLSQNAGDKEWNGFNAELMKLCKRCLANNENKSPIFKNIYLHGFSAALYNVGFQALNNGDIQKALEYFNNSLNILKKSNDKYGIASVLNALGSIYENQGDITKALEYYFRSLKIMEEINDKFGIANAYNSIGFIYSKQGDKTKALEYFQSGLKIEEEIDDKQGVAYSLNNIGYIYTENGSNTEALECFQNSIIILEFIEDKAGIGSSLACIGNIYDNIQDFPKALNYYHRSLKVYEEIKSKKGIAKSLSNIGTILIKQGNYKEALNYGKRSLELAKELGYPDIINKAASTLKKIYRKQNNFSKALEMYELEIQMRDSINNEETKKVSIKKQFQYTYEKQAAADSVKHAEEKKVKNVQLMAQEALLKQEKTKSYALYGGLALVLVFAGFMVNRFKVTHKQKQIIELKEIETQKQNKIITIQKNMVEEKHREITDSINYAERIQRSFLATKEQLDEQLKDYFILFQPKDVVSGDFYWAHTLNNRNFALVTADSTGHGVPGAIMSLLNTSSLERAVELGITEPAEILNHTRKTIIERLKKDGSADGGKDGMDCSLMSFNSNKSKLTYSAANNPIWIIRENTMIELVANKMPVGKHDKDTISFTQHEIELQKGDLIYTLTDGFPDQFGGPKGKKFMYKRLKEILISISNLPLNEQHNLLKNSLNKWMGNTEQVDDITVIGIRV